MGGTRIMENHTDRDTISWGTSWESRNRDLPHRQTHDWLGISWESRTMENHTDRHTTSWGLVEVMEQPHRRHRY